jgi:F-type H+-transporting ATPase subunit delta
MSTTPVARRYARALLDVAGAEAEAVLGQLEALTSFFAGAPDVLAALASPALSKAQRHTLLGAVVKAIPGLHPMLVNTLPLLTRQYRDLVDARVGRVRGQVTSAVALQPAQVSAIAQSLKALTRSEVVLAEKVDPRLLGGVVAQVGSTVYDGSLRSQLKDLGRTLA